MSARSTNKQFSFIILLIIFAIGCLSFYFIYRVKDDSNTPTTESVLGVNEDKEISQTQAIERKTQKAIQVVRKEKTPIKPADTTCNNKDIVRRECHECNTAKVTTYNESCDLEEYDAYDQLNCGYLCKELSQKRLEPGPVPPTFDCNCSKQCNQISSCDEAYYIHYECACNNLDGDGNGIPCENICN